MKIDIIIEDEVIYLYSKCNGYLYVIILDGETDEFKIFSVNIGTIFDKIQVIHHYNKINDSNHNLND